MLGYNHQFIHLSLTIWFDYNVYQKKRGIYANYEHKWIQGTCLETFEKKPTAIIRYIFSKDGTKKICYPTSTISAEFFMTQYSL